MPICWKFWLKIELYWRDLVILRISDALQPSPKQKKLSKRIDYNWSLKIFLWFENPPRCYGCNNRIQGVQYNVFVAMSGLIRRTSRDNLCQKLGLKSFNNRRWLRKMCYFCRLIITQSLVYLLDSMPSSLNSSHHFHSVIHSIKFYLKYSSWSERMDQTGYWNSQLFILATV